MGATRGRGVTGTLIAATAATRSGCSSGAFHTTAAPQSCPTHTARSRADVVEQTDQVGGQLMNVVGVDGIRTIRAAVAALIGRQHVVAGVGEDGNLMTPGVGQFGEAVRQDHHGCAAVARFGHPQPHTVGLY